MNSLTWIGIIVWGIVMAGCGLAWAGTPATGATELQPHDVVFVVTGGLLTILIGVAGLMGLMGWIPGLRKEQKTVA
jgi:heme/copper-type cytochrome/quinol oxidase subunit 2